jgi:RNA-splicing ligase RtcB
MLPSLIDELTNNLKNSHPNGYLLDDDMAGYITDVFFAQAYAKFNHKVICDLIIDIMRKFDMKTDGEIIYTTHNYISPRDHIIRKGAIASYEGDKMIIPFNMRDGLAICVGKSNDEWNCSAPHGAGRLMSRSKAKTNVDIEEFKKSMEGIYSTSVGKGTLDESPMVYKDHKEILTLIEPTADVLFLIKPKINIKAFESCEEN